MKNWQHVLSRRDFVRLTLQGGVAVLIGGCANFRPELSNSRDLDTSDASEFLKTYSPIDRTLGEVVPRQFSGGDVNDRPHGILWDLPGYFQTHKVEGKPEEASVVVIGGGMSGLFSTYALRKLQPILLEQAPRFGGNAKGQ